MLPILHDADEIETDLLFAAEGLEQVLPRRRLGSFQCQRHCDEAHGGFMVNQRLQHRLAAVGAGGLKYAVGADSPRIEVADLGERVFA